jgi:hypothetical protein
MSKFKDPSDVIIEKTAGEFAGVFYDAARSSGMDKVKLQGKVINLLKYKSTRAFARDCLEAFIPAAVHALNQILANPNTPPDQKEVIYNALMERVNDVTLIEMGKTAGLPEYENTILYKSDQEKPKPIIINSPKLDFSFNSVREKN